MRKCRKCVYKIDVSFLISWHWSAISVKSIFILLIYYFFFALDFLIAFCSFSKVLSIFQLTTFPMSKLKIDQIIEKVSFYEWWMDYNFFCNSHFDVMNIEHTYYVAKCISMTSLHSISLTILIPWQNCRSM